ncbi:phage tail assembly chaperone [Phaeobacter gallaeciensis]|uniref:rcc01693 family protein n=1 Tax=Phaeobacter gallaeciensis TaxID=60890 RepID=UPI00237F7D19|nr:rcc01693 family protein [Phaeobacter gallaeciensis]MDE4304398.1 phage tail assembly chaperone [Phaeobacter gallaeciensis]MDE4308259.1 phage tail assembly chaperone [Phaeobacter gallaeciensis]MDE4312716.1 phage tail assembly chaperone [Phaeobacter gallaeciensis]MDE4317329.1 phage tail assembly chaperone [Phaeobacter gallaeciensis]MDE4321792.1 phage tail assembly chaperone [Phaeobacter gallaeciensis]
MSGFDWPALLRLGLVGLRLSPDAFWRLTPAELRLMLAPVGADGALNRAGLEDLIAAFPDTPKAKDADHGRE